MLSRSVLLAYRYAIALLLPLSRFSRVHSSWRAPYHPRAGLSWNAEAGRSSGEAEETRRGCVSGGRGGGFPAASLGRVGRGALRPSRVFRRSRRASRRVPSHSQMLPAPPGQPVIDSIVESQREAPALWLAASLAFQAKHALALFRFSLSHSLLLLNTQTHTHSHTRSHTHSLSHTHSHRPLCSSSCGSLPQPR